MPLKPQEKQRLTLTENGRHIVKERMAHNYEEDDLFPDRLEQDWFLIPETRILDPNFPPLSR